MRKKILLAAKNRTTYRTGLLQAKAYRVLKQRTTAALEPFDMSAIDWAFLGLLNDYSSGIRAQDAAEELGVEPPFITRLFIGLQKKEYAVMHIDPRDQRVRLILITPKGKRLVPKIEAHVRKEMKPLIKGVSYGDLMSYIAVLDGIIENSNERGKDMK